MPQKREAVSRMLDRLAVDFRVFDAIIGANVNVADYSRYLLENKLVPGEVGCLLSHVTVWEKHLNSPHSALIVFEDDAQPTEHFADPKATMFRHLELVTAIDPEWDILYLGRCYDICSDTIFYPEEEIVGGVKPACNHAYAIRVKSIARIISMGFPTEKPIDGILGDLAKARRIRAYASNPPVFKQNGAPTTIPGRSGSIPGDQLPTCSERWGDRLERFTALKKRAQSALPFLGLALVVVGIIAVGWIILRKMRSR
jgi:glycosyl transferase family 25